MRVLILILILVGTSFTLPMIGTTFLTSDYVYQQLANNTKIDINILKDAKYQIKYFPIPYLLINEINYKDKLNIKNIRIDFSLLSLAILHPQAKEVTIDEATLVFNHQDISIVHHDKLITNLLEQVQDILTFEAKINQLICTTAKDGTVILIDNFNLTHQRIAGTVNFSGNIGDKAFSGSFARQDKETLFQLKINDEKNDFYIEETYNNGTLQSGNIHIKTTELFNYLASLVPDISRMPQLINPQNQVEISCSVVPTDKGLSFNNLTIQSDTIQGKGYVHASDNHNQPTLVKIEFDKIDLSAQSTQNQYGLNLYKNINRFDLQQNNFIADIYVKKLIINSTNNFSDINLRAQAYEGKLYLRDFSGIADQDGSFSITGVITQNAFRSLFVGNIKLRHKDMNDWLEFFGDANMRTKDKTPFTFFAKIHLNAVNFTLQDFVLAMPTAKIRGTFSAKFISNQQRNHANIDFSLLNADQATVPVISHVLNYVFDLTQDMHNEGYISKFKPIRTIQSTGNYNINFDQLVIDKKLYKDVKFNVKLLRGQIAVEHLYIERDQNWLDASMVIEANGVKPNLSIVVHNGALNVDFFSAPGLLALRNNILQQYDLTKINISTQGALESLIHNDVILEQVVFALRNNENLINISQFNADVFGGKMQLSGSVLLDPYTLNFVYALNSAKIAQIAKLLPAGYLNTDGMISASGMWSTNGQALDQQLYNLYTKSNIVVKDMEINNFAIDDFIQQVNNNYDLHKMQHDTNKMLLVGKTKITDLKADVELTQGIFDVRSIMFKTQYSAGSSDLTFNIYDFNLNAAAVFAFYLANSYYKHYDTDPVRVTVTAVGNIFNPKKNADTTRLTNALSTMQSDRAN